MLQTSTINYRLHLGHRGS